MAQGINIPGACCGNRLLSRPAQSQGRSRPQQQRGYSRQVSVRAVLEAPTLPFQRESLQQTQWSPDSWKQYTAHQQPNYQDPQRLRDAVDTIARMPPLVFAGECRNLQDRLAKCATGQAFLVQGTSCSDVLWHILLFHNIRPPC